MRLQKVWKNAYLKIREHCCLNRISGYAETKRKISNHHPHTLRPRMQAPQGRIRESYRHPRVGRGELGERDSGGGGWGLMYLPR